jgi:hypothetical protein
MLALTGGIDACQISATFTKGTGLSLIGELVRIKLNISDIGLRRWRSNNRAHVNYITLKNTTTAGLIVKIEYATERIWMACLRAGELWISHTRVQKKRRCVNGRELEARAGQNHCWLPAKGNTLRLQWHEKIRNEENTAKVEAKHDQVHCKRRVKYETFTICVCI